MADGPQVVRFGGERSANEDARPYGGRTVRDGKAISPIDVIRAAGQRLPNGEKLRVRANTDGTYTILNVLPETFFGPLQPMFPLAQDPALGAVGRRYDYRTGLNTQYTPRSEEYITFDQLRELSYNLDVLRLVIETRKDEMESLEWAIQPRDKKEDLDSPRVKKILDFMRYPDREHTYSEWMRALLEDRFVIDAMCIYPRMTNGGELYSLDWMDGALITPMLDAYGRRPIAPQVAYQQIIKGAVAANYCAEPVEGMPSDITPLIYRIGNPRTNKRYGFSAVEQVLVTVNTALRRQLFVLSYYTDGSVPDAFCMVPDTWSPANIAEYQNHFDALYENPTGQNAAIRRKMRFMPGGDVKFAKEAILKDEFDEWIARIVCYAFSVEPTPFIKQMNRSTAATQREASRAQGLIPLKRWWKGLMDYIVAVYFKAPDLEFAWQDEDAADPATQADIHVKYVNSGILSRNEVREDMGREASPDPVADELTIQNTEVPIDDAGAPPGGSTQPPSPKDDGAAAAEAAQKFLRAQARLVKGSGADPDAIKIKAPKIVSGVGVPYVAGMNKDRARCYIDESIPLWGKTKSGWRFRPRKYLCVHECVEIVLVEDDGFPYDDNKDSAHTGHGLALRAEHAAVAADGGDPAEYEEWFQPYDEDCYRRAKAGEMERIPTDLARYAYAAEGELALIGVTAEKLAKAGKLVRGKPINRNRVAVRIQTERLTRAIKRAFRGQKAALKTWYGNNAHKFAKAAGDDDQLPDEPDYNDIFWHDWDDTVKDPLQRVSKDAVTASVAGIPAAASASVGDSFVNDYSVQYAKDRGAEMVGKRYNDDGELVDNPDARWAISETTRDGVRKLLTQAMEDGWSNDRFAEAVEDAYEFSPSRALVVARTETALADSAGHVAGWKESGVVKRKEWLTAHDDLVSEDCTANEDAGPIDLDDDFPSGDHQPPLHPRCRCVVVPLISQEGDEE